MTSSAPQIVSEVAAAVGLAEGEAGVGDVVRAVARLEPVAVRRVSRATELPVPIVSAICNELRKRGVVSPRRPVQLTARGRDLFEGARVALSVDAACSTCAQREIVVPESLAAVAKKLAVAEAAAPPTRLELDQAHCTVETKIRRVLVMHEEGALDGKRVLLLGDDDLTSLAIKLVAEQLGVGAAIREVVVVDIDAALVSFLQRSLRAAPFRIECVVHDLREPLPERLRQTADTVFTDPPYTSEGAALFLSRAVEAADRGSRADVFLAFGARRPEVSLAVQRTISEMGLVVRRLVRNFNEYLGAGALGGTSHLYQLATTSGVRSAVRGRHAGPLYTGDHREPVRSYRCKRCTRTQRVGRGQMWAGVEALRRDGCPRCGGTAFVPLARGAAR
jgi:predicted methyltransferase